MAHCYRACLTVGACFLLHAGEVCAVEVRDAPRVSESAYARAERFLAWNKDRYVRNADLQPHWIGDSDKFWYVRTTPANDKEFVLVDARTGKTRPAFDPGKAAVGNTEVMPGEIQSPDSRWTAQLRDHNILVRALPNGTPFELTHDGVQYHAYGSLPGQSTHAIGDIRRHELQWPQVVWSPDSRYLLTYRLDEREVKDLHLIQSVPEDGTLRPKLYTYRYALAGDIHVPAWKPVVLDVINRRQINLETEPIVCGPIAPIEKRDLWWSSNGRALYFLARDRYSKVVSLERADPVNGEVTRVLTEKSDTVVHTNAGSVFEFPLIRTLSDGSVIWYSQRDGWGHLYYYDESGDLHNQITQGEWSVRDIVRVDEHARRIYFMASGRELGSDPYEQRLYAVNFDGTKLQLLTPEQADHKIQFSPSGRYFVDGYSRPDLPPTWVARASDGALIRKLEQADISGLREGGYVPVEPFQVTAADGKTALYGNLFRPSTFDPSRRYPVIDASYPGPQAIRSGKSFTSALFHRFEAQSLAELGFIVVTIDGRGTPNRSREFLDYSYGRLDKASDLEDHIAGIGQLATRYPWLDLDRVGIDGVSAGGFLAALAVLKYPAFYKVAVSAEGNHDPRGYLAAWGETYIGPSAGEAYLSSATPQLAANLRGKLLLIHGELDDNVPPALTLRLADALIKANKDFDLLVIPNADHTAYFTSPYLIRRKWDYFVRHLMGAEPPLNYSISGP
jgi:dipeptidyl-peptidase 4